MKKNEVRIFEPGYAKQEGPWQRTPRRVIRLVYPERSSLPLPDNENIRGQMTHSGVTGITPREDSPIPSSDVTLYRKNSKGAPVVVDTTGLTQAEKLTRIAAALENDENEPGVRRVLLK